jgi:biotin operon repressor
MVCVLLVSENLLRHRRDMGPSIWEYLWLLAHVSSGSDWQPAIVEHGRPVSTGRIAADLKRSREAVLANLERLEAGNYIARSAAAGHAYSYKVFTLLAEHSK